MDSVTISTISRCYDGKYMCGICGSKFTIKLNINRHIKSHSSIMYYQCDKCNMTFISSSSLYMHLETHNDK